MSDHSNVKVAQVQKGPNERVASQTVNKATAESQSYKICFITQYLLSSGKWRSIGLHPHGQLVPQVCRSESISAWPHLRLLYELAGRVRIPLTSLAHSVDKLIHAHTYAFTQWCECTCKERTQKTKQTKTQGCLQTELLSGI